MIQAPGVNEFITTLLTALLSYNRPLIFLAFFVLVLIATYFLSKKNLLISLTISIIIVLAVALYFVITYFSGIREGTSSAFMQPASNTFSNSNENTATLETNLGSQKSQAASLLDFPCQYSVKVTQTANPTLFIFQLPWETKTPVDMSGIIAGNLSDFKSGNIKALKVIPGPFKWTPDTNKDWNYSYNFGSVPEVITIGHGAYVRMENGKEINEFRYACSVWQKPTTLKSTCPPSLMGPVDGAEIYGSSGPTLTWGSCNMVRGQQAIQLNITGGTNHPVNFTSDALITTNYLVDPQYIPLDPGARYSWKIRVCNINASQKCVSSASAWSFPRTFYWQTRTKSLAITSCPFTISISGNPNKPTDFNFYVPSGSVRSNLVRIDGVMAAKSDGNVQVVPGPLPWTNVSTPPNMSKYSKTFQFSPQFVAGGMVTYNGFNDQISYGCGYLKLTPTPIK